MKVLVLLILISITTLSVSSRAEIGETHHFLAHAGAGYALTTIGYGVFRKGADLSKPTSLVLSILLANAISIGREAIVAKQRHTNLDWHDVRNTAAGVVLSTGTILVFDF